MSFKFLRPRARALFGFQLFALLLLPAASLAEPAADAIAVNVDQAKLVRLPTPTR